MEAGPRATAQPPLAILAQARLAAASGVGLDLLLRRFLAVSSLVTLYVTEAAGRASLSSEGRGEVVRTQVLVCDRFVEAVVEEYKHAQDVGGVADEPRLRLIKGLLAGKMLDAGIGAYGFERHHLAVVVEGLEAQGLRDLSAELSAELLWVRPSASMKWAWMATGEELKVDAVRSAVRRTLPARCVVALGASEPGSYGWQASHMQAISALSIAIRTGVPTFYESVMLLASAASDHVRGSFLRRHYLDPIKQSPPDADKLLKTLRAYFAADRNASSTAAALEVSRQAVANRIEVVEQRLGRRLTSCAPEIQLALRLDELDQLELAREPGGA